MFQAMEVDDSQPPEGDDVTIIEEKSLGSDSEQTKTLPALAPKPQVVIRRSVPGHRLMPARFVTHTGHPGFINAWRMLKKQEQLKRGPKEKETFRRTMYCLPDKHAKLPKFSSSDLAEKALVQEHQDLGFGK